MEVFGRFSVQDDDDGWSAYQKHGAGGSDWRITLDGEDVPKVVTADTVTGEILANELDDNGKAFIRDHAVARRALRGSVRVFVIES